MKSCIFFAIACLSFLSFRSAQNSPETAIVHFQENTQRQIANDIADNLSNKQYAAVQKDFLNTFKSQLTVDILGRGWENLLLKVGDFDKILSTTSTTVQGYPVVKVQCKFKNSNANIEVTFNESNKVVGLFLKP